MNLNEFYDDCQTLPDNERQWLDVFYRNVVEVFGEDNQNFDNDYNVCRLFYGRSLSLSRAQYYRKKKLVHRLYNWLTAKGAVSDEYASKVYDLRLQDIVLDSELYRYYFKDLDHVLKYISFVGRKNGMGAYDDMLNIKAIAILSWYNVGLAELLSLHKTDLHPATQTVTTEKKQIHLSEEHFDILRRFAEVDIHRGFPSQKEQVYVESPFLVRSARQTHLNPNNIQCAIRRFNTVSTKYGKELSLLNLRRNGIFSEVYTSTEHKTVDSIIRDLIDCNVAFSLGYKEFYERWKRLIIGGGMD